MLITKSADNRPLSARLALIWTNWQTGVVLAFLIAPVLAIIPLSFNAGSYFSYPMSGYSLRWYEKALLDPDWQRAFLNSLGIGAMATLVATILGTLAALGLSRPSFPWRSVIMPLLISPMIIPVVVVAVGFYLVFAPLGLTNSYAGVVLAHAALGTPFVVITVTASLLSFARSARAQSSPRLVSVARDARGTTLALGLVDGVPPRYPAARFAGCRHRRNLRVRHVVRRSGRDSVHRRTRPAHRAAPDVERHP